MTRKEFLGAYNIGHRDGKAGDYFPNDYDDIFDIEQEPCVDVVSRAEVFEQINCWIGSGEYRYKNATWYLSNRLKVLPSVQPKQKPIILKANEKQFEELKEAIRKNPLCAVMAEPKTDVLDKIRAEIEELNNIDYVEPVTAEEILKIIDKYRGEK